MIVDLHTHLVPEHFPQAAGRGSGRWPSMDHFEPGRAKVTIAGANFRTVTDQCWSRARRSADLPLEGVDAQVVSPMPELLSYWFSPADGLDMSRYVNDQIASLVQASPTQFYGLGMVPLQDPALAARELTAVKSAGLRGVELGSNVLGRSLGEERFAEFFAELERLDLCAFVHALHPTFSDRFPATEQLINAIGFPSDTGLTIASMIASGLIERHPGVRLAFSHGGGTLPFFLPRLQHAWSGRWNGEPPAASALPNPFRQSLPRSPVDYARGLFYDTLLFDARAIRYLVDMVGISQVTVGTDYPFVPREQPVAATLKSMGLSPDEWDQVSWRNCLRFLGLSGEAT